MSDKDVVIAELRRVVADQARTITGLSKVVANQSALIEQMKGEISDLRLQVAKLSKNSRTSSKSPSSDLVKPPSPTKPKGRRKPKPGGQPGHERKVRELLPPERVDETIVHEIPVAEAQARGLTATNEFEVVQYFELPESLVQVTEHHLRKYLDESGNTVLPIVPGVTDQPIFGPRFLSLIGWLKSRAHCSYSTIAECVRDVLEVPVSRGYLAKLCNGVISASLAEAHEELKQAIPAQTVLGSDESSLPNNGKKNWIWCISASLFTLFHIATSRSRAVLEELIGITFKGCINFDYYSSNCSFAWHFDIKAQYCWAHLIRDIRFLEKIPHSETNTWAHQLLDRAKRMFQAWHQRDQMTDIGFQRSMMHHRDSFLELIDDPPDSQGAENLCERFRVVTLTDRSEYDMSENYFRFMFEAGVEPTNNHSEQQIRHCVIDRKITQGTRSAAGQRYHERMWTAIATCGKQNRSFYQFLKASIESCVTGTPHPSLLPQQTRC